MGGINMEDKFNIKKHSMFIPERVYRKAVVALIKSVSDRKDIPKTKQQTIPDKKGVSDYD